MINPNDIIDALSKASAYDAQHTPKPSKILVDAWLEHFRTYSSAVTREDLLAAVTEYHREPHDRMLQPADLSSIARMMRRDRHEREPLEPRPALTSGQSPDDAHRARLERVIASFDANDDDDAKALKFLQALSDSPLKIACSWCGAVPGQRCRIPGTRQVLTKTRAHPARVEAAEKARANAS